MTSALLELFVSKFYLICSRRTNSRPVYGRKHISRWSCILKYNIFCFFLNIGVYHRHSTHSTYYFRMMDLILLITHFTLCLYKIIKQKSSCFPNYKWFSFIINYILLTLFLLCNLMKFSQSMLLSFDVFSFLHYKKNCNIH